jgi:hypothetical protein
MGKPKTPEEKAAELAAKEQAIREKLVAELSEFTLEVQLTGSETVDELKEKLAKAKADKKAADKAAADADDDSPITIKFRDHVGVTVERTFSKEVHGPAFKMLADEFKVTNAARIVA